MASGNRAYVNAANQERRVKAKLEAEGWTCWRTPGSKSPADLVCVRGVIDRRTIDEPVVPEVLLVQCKSGVRAMSGPRRTEFAAYAAAIGASCLLVERGMKFTWLWAGRQEDAA